MIDIYFQLKNQITIGLICRLRYDTNYVSMSFELHPQIALKAIPCSLAPSSEQLLTIRKMFYDRYLFSVKKSDHNRTNMQAKIRYKLRLDDVRSSPSNCLESYSMQPGECATLVAFIG